MTEAGNETWFRKLDFLKRRKHAYQFAFGNPAGADVLVDLARFCRANETCVVPGDNDRTKVLEGRREVWLRIQNHLGLTPEQLMELFDGQAVTVKKE